MGDVGKLTPETYTLIGLTRHALPHAKIDRYVQNPKEID